jgi:hypothetical protein
MCLRKWGVALYIVHPGSRWQLMVDFTPHLNYGTEIDLAAHYLRGWLGPSPETRLFISSSDNQMLTNLRQTVTTVTWLPRAK